MKNSHCPEKSAQIEASRAQDTHCRNVIVITGSSRLVKHVDRALISESVIRQSLIDVSVSRVSKFCRILRPSIDDYGELNARMRVHTCVCSLVKNCTVDSPRGENYSNESR